jgi:hypothetical protein
MAWLDRLTTDDKKHLKYVLNNTTLKGCTKEIALNGVKEALNYQNNVLKMNHPCWDCVKLLNRIENEDG